MPLSPARESGTKEKPLPTAIGRDPEHHSKKPAKESMNGTDILPFLDSVCKKGMVRHETT